MYFAKVSRQDSWPTTALFRYHCTGGGARWANLRRAASTSNESVCVGKLQRDTKNTSGHEPRHVPGYDAGLIANRPYLSNVLIDARVIRCRLRQQAGSQTKAFDG